MKSFTSKFTIPMSDAPLLSDKLNVKIFAVPGATTLRGGVVFRTTMGDGGDDGGTFHTPNACQPEFDDASRAARY